MNIKIHPVVYLKITTVYIRSGLFSDTEVFRVVRPKYQLLPAVRA